MNLEVLKLATELAKIVGASVVFSIGLWQYWKAQKWKRREFIAAQVKQFESDKKIQLAMTMLDWNKRDLYFPSEVPDKLIVVTVDSALLCSALLPHDPDRPYGEKEEMIRDCFDRFLDMLVMFWNFIEADLITTAELKPYMEYWVRLICNKPPENTKNWHPPQLSYLFRNHIKVYGFEGAESLIKSFGYDPQPPKAELEEAIKATLDKRLESISRL